MNLKNKKCILFSKNVVPWSRQKKANCSQLMGSDQTPKFAAKKNIKKIISCLSMHHFYLTKGNNSKDNEMVHVICIQQ